MYADSLAIALAFGGLATRSIRQVASEAQIQMDVRHYYTLNSTVASYRASFEEVNRTKSESANGIDKSSVVCCYLFWHLPRPFLFVHLHLLVPSLVFALKHTRRRFKLRQSNEFERLVCSASAHEGFDEPSKYTSTVA
jgi:hypothetical protein